MAPQFKVTTATTSNFSLQWIEWSDAAALPAGVVMPESFLVASVATNFMIGTYAAADGVYFNVFTAGFEPVTSTALDFPPSDAAGGFQKIVWDADIAGSIGDLKYYLNNKDSLLSYDTDGVVATANGYDAAANAMFFTPAIEALAPIYAAYGSAVTAYNTDAEDYNTAVEAYNEALADTKVKEADYPEVPEAPCAPTAPAAWGGFEIITDEAWNTA